MNTEENRDKPAIIIFILTSYFLYITDNFIITTDSERQLGDKICFRRVFIHYNN